MTIKAELEDIILKLEKSLNDAKLITEIPDNQKLNGNFENLCTLVQYWKNTIIKSIEERLFLITEHLTNSRNYFTTINNSIDKLNTIRYRNNDRYNDPYNIVVTDAINNYKAVVSTTILIFQFIDTKNNYIEKLDNIIKNAENVIINGENTNWEGYKKDVVDSTQAILTELKEKSNIASGVINDNINLLMVKTFDKEFRIQRIERNKWTKYSLFSLFAIILVISLFMCIGDKITLEIFDIKLIFFHTEDLWLRFANKLFITLPLGFIFWFCSKKHDTASILSAEYRHKKAVVEALIGYKEHNDKLGRKDDEDFKNEYKLFFEETFKEINKNPADKINKLIIKNQFKIKHIKEMIDIMKK